MKKNNILFLLLYLFLFSFTSYAQTWEHFPKVNNYENKYVFGVDSNYVYVYDYNRILLFDKITQNIQGINIPNSEICNYYDNGKVKLGVNGDIWLPLYNNGLYRYTNGNWINYNSTNSTIISNRVTSIDVSPSGEVYAILNYESVAKFDGTNWSYFDSTNSPLNHNLYEVDARKSDRVVFQVGYNSNANYVMYDGVSFDTSFAANPPYPDLTSTGFMDRLGNFWLSAYDTATQISHTLKYSYNNTWSIYTYNDLFCTTPQSGVMGGLFAGKNTNALFYIVPHVSLLIHDIDSNTCNSFLADNFRFVDDYNGDIWYSNNTTLSKFDHLNGNVSAVYTFLNATSNNSLLKYSFIFPSFKDHNNHLWFGTYSQSAFENYLIEFVDTNSFIHNLSPYLGGTNNTFGILSISEDPLNNIMYFGMADSKLVTFDGTIWDSSRVMPSPWIGDSPQISGIAFDRNNNAVLTFTTFYSAGIPPAASPGIAIKQGNIWLFDTLTSHGSSTNNAYCVTIDTTHNRNDYWIGTIGSGIMLKTNNGYQHFTSSNSPLPSNTVRCISIDNSGRKWIGTSNGLAIYNDTTWVVYDTLNSDLPNNYIHDIAFNYNNNFEPWISTKNGVCRFEYGAGINFFPCINPLTYKNVTSVTFDNNCNLWLGNIDNTSSTWTVYGAVDRINNVCFMDIDSIEGTLLKTNGNPFANHTVSFFRKSSGGASLQFIGETLTDANGKYLYLTNDSLVYVYATYDEVNYPFEYPVYQNNKLVMQDAQEMHLSGLHKTVANLQCQTPLTSTTFNGTISGVVNNASLLSEPARIFLVNTVTQTVSATRLLNTDGAINFTNIPQGEYQIYIDKFGIDNTSSPSLNLSSTNQLTGLQFYIQPNKIILINELSNNVKEAETIPTFFVYPNPVNNHLTVFSSEIQNFKVFNSVGTEVFSGICNTFEKKYNVSFLSKGLYFIITSNGSAKFIKQ